MGKKKKSVSQVVIVHSDTSGDDPKPDTILDEPEKTTAEISMPADIAPPTPTEDTTSPIQTAEKEQLHEEAPILSKTDDVVAEEPAPENDKKEQKDELKTVETTPSESSVELKEIQVKPEDEPNKKTKTNCSKGWCMIL